MKPNAWRIELIVSHEIGLITNGEVEGHAGQTELD